MCSDTYYAIAHRHHGSQIRTLWTKLYPESLADRDERPSNVLVEAHISNFVKHNFREGNEGLAFCQSGLLQWLEGGLGMLRKMNSFLLRKESIEDSEISGSMKT